MFVCIHIYIYMYVYIDANILILVSSSKQAWMKMLLYNECLLPHYIKHSFRLSDWLDTWKTAKRKGSSSKQQFFRCELLISGSVSLVFLFGKGTGFVGFLLKEAISQLMKMMPKEEVQRQWLCWELLTDTKSWGASLWKDLCVIILQERSTYPTKGKGNSASQLPLDGIGYIVFVFLIHVSSSRLSWTKCNMTWCLWWIHADVHRQTSCWICMKVRWEVEPRL